MPAGTYTLVIELGADARIGFGAAGERALGRGRYAYVGSAFGPGGLDRVQRHRELAAGGRDARHWHVDYLLGHPAARVVGAVTTEGVDVECALARRLAAGDPRPVPGLGASDCGCDTHLFGAGGREPLERAVRKAHRRARGDAGDAHP